MFTIGFIHLEQGAFARHGTNALVCKSSPQVTLDIESYVGQSHLMAATT